MNKANIDLLVTELRKVAAQGDEKLKDSILALGNWHLQEKTNSQVLKLAGVKNHSQHGEMTKEASTSEEHLHRLLSLSLNK